jgi:hypothetical protein
MSISSANAVIMFTAGVVFPQPYQLQQFSADNVLGSDPIAAAETQMGVDGKLTAGFINTPTRQTYYLMADSPSTYFFDQLYFQEKSQQDKIPIFGSIIFPAVKKRWAMVKGFLVEYPPVPRAGKTLKELEYIVLWESALPQPF